MFKYEIITPNDKKLFNIIKKKIFICHNRFPQKFKIK